MSFLILNTEEITEIQSKKNHKNKDKVTQLEKYHLQRTLLNTV